MAIIEHLEAVTYGQIRNLLINVPPRHMKSLLVSVFWPAWEWIPPPNLPACAGVNSVYHAPRCSAVDCVIPDQRGSLLVVAARTTTYDHSRPRRFTFEASICFSDCSASCSGTSHR